MVTSFDKIQGNLQTALAQIEAERDVYYQTAYNEKCLELTPNRNACVEEYARARDEKIANAHSFFETQVRAKDEEVHTEATAFAQSQANQIDKILNGLQVIIDSTKTQ